MIVDAVIEQVDAGGGDAATRLRRLFRLADSMDHLLGIELAIRDWARREQAWWSDCVGSTTGGPAHSLGGHEGHPAVAPDLIWPRMCQEGMVRRRPSG